MGVETTISWTDSTINVWHGCSKVSEGCKHCYAEVSTPVRVKRAAGLEVWGANAARSETKGWRTDLRRWNKAALASGKVHRVFGQSLSDTFEDARGGRVINRYGADTGDSLDWLRAEFFAAIEAAPALTFQLLTKRPENIKHMVPPHWLVTGAPTGSRLGWPAHVWIGATVEDQENADERIPHLLRVPATVRFLSVEPQVGPVDLIRYCATRTGLCGHCGGIDGDHDLAHHGAIGGIAQVIQGGESGRKARPFHLEWARDLRDQCRAAGVAYFLKQLGARPESSSGVTPDGRPWGTNRPVTFPVSDSHGGNEDEWPADLRDCRAFPAARGGSP